MRWPRVSIRSLMVLMAVVGVNLAAWRALVGVTPIVSLAPVALALQLATWGAFRPCPRPFRAGTAAGGLLGLASLLWVFFDPPSTSVHFDPISGARLVTEYPGAATARIWEAYLDRVVPWLTHPPSGYPVWVVQDAWIGLDGLLGTVLITPPIAASALAGGLLARGAAAAWRLRGRAGPCTAAAGG